MKSTLVVLSVVGAAVIAANPWHVTQGEVRVICPMTIGGSFEATTAALSGSVAASASGSRALDGSLAVDLRTLDTGISLRNGHLRDNYLEVAKGQGFDTATLSEIELKGMDPDAPEGKGSFTGVLGLHGVRTTVTGAVDVRRAATGLHVKASFPVNLPDYGIQRPRYLGVGVKDTVTVQVTFAIVR